MTQEYEDYLNSESWKNKRKQRLLISNNRCSVCGSNGSGIQVHHLTYERIFNEDMQDLLPLCKYDHEIAEKLVDQRRLSRHGNPLFLATETVRLVLLEKMSEALPRPIPTPIPIPTSNRTIWKIIRKPKEVQSDLMTQSWFLEALELSREDFKHVCRKQFKGKRRSKMMSNAFAIYDRIRPF